MDGEGVLRNRNIWGHHILAQSRGEGLNYYLQNYHHDVVALTGEDGAVLNRYDYDAFGNVLEAEETVSNRFKYSGEQYDGIMGQYYLLY